LITPRSPLGHSQQFLLIHSFHLHLHRALLLLLLLLLLLTTQRRVQTRDPCFRDFRQSHISHLLPLFN
jgi:hypothetical protein